MLGLVGSLLGLSVALTGPPLYTSEATFVPEESEQVQSDIASLLGLQEAAANGAWSSALYIELLRNRAIAEAVARKSVVVAEQGGRRVSFVDLLGVRNGDSSRRDYQAVQAVKKMVTVSTQERIKGVNISVSTQWPSVSRQLADSLLRAVSDFNLESRRSAAKAEREFAELQAGQSAQAARAAEDRLQQFLQRNRAVDGSPELVSERARLQRQASAQRGQNSSWVQSLEDARVREVRATPVITVLEQPRLPVVPERRHAVRKALFGGINFVILGVLWSSWAYAMNALRRSRSQEARDFFSLIDDITRGRLRRAHG